MNIKQVRDPDAIGRDELACVAGTIIDRVSALERKLPPKPHWAQMIDVEGNHGKTYLRAQDISPVR